ncbi:hypothetical protein HPB51_002996 [Rhipicephalus microplus]|uniref:Uncharacterized protein n=1 Tax=Rhipicephalus microplus TaxID=6941 RepID=A0A9J6DT88_RHIMP|nr:hypothetical protein HPB51_002996 [Rhipicephalus microplus]
MQDVDIDDAENALMTKMSKGGLKFPQALVVNGVLLTEIILEKLRVPEYLARFLSLPMLKDTLVSLVFCAIAGYENLDVCDSGNSAQEQMEHVVSAAANTLLNKLCRTGNEKLHYAKNEGKLETLKT